MIRQSWRPGPGGVSAHELLLALHPPADRHHAAGHRACSWSAPSPTCSCRSPACRPSNFPTIRVTASRPGADPKTMAATVAAPLERRLGEIAGVTEMTSTSSLGASPDHRPVRPQPQHRRRRARRAGGAQRRAHRPARRPAVAADVPQGQSGGGADPDPGADLEDHVAERGLRRRRHGDRAAPVAGRRRRRCHRRRRRAAGHPRPRQPDAARLHGAYPWRTCAPPSPTPTRSGPLGTSTASAA